MSNLLSILLCVLFFMVLIPIIGYYTVKLGTYANLRARDIYRQRHPQARVSYGEENERET